jgi:hypothetical protein
MIELNSGIETIEFLGLFVSIVVVDQQIHRHSTFLFNLDCIFNEFFESIAKALGDRKKLLALVLKSIL